MQSINGQNEYTGLHEILIPSEVVKLDRYVAIIKKMIIATDHQILPHRVFRIPKQISISNDSPSIEESISKSQFSENAKVLNDPPEANLKTSTDSQSEIKILEKSSENIHVDLSRDIQNDISRHMKWHSTKQNNVRCCKVCNLNEVYDLNGAFYFFELHKNFPICINWELLFEKLDKIIITEKRPIKRMDALPNLKSTIRIFTVLFDNKKINLNEKMMNHMFSVYENLSRRKYVGKKFRDIFPRELAKKLFDISQKISDLKKI